MTKTTGGGQGAKGGSKGGKSTGDLKWWQLSIIGIGCTIGTGYFLGSSIGIKEAGPSIILSFILAALGTYIVFNLLAKMTAEDPQEGSFCYYADKAYGRWAGFSSGWNYWCSNILIMGSQLTALSILSQFWFKDIPLWIFAAGYALLSIFVVLLGTKGFDRIENVLAITKTAAIFMFIILAAAAVFGWIKGGSIEPNFPTSKESILPEGFKGLWSSLIYAFYAYGGIEVIGLMAIQLKNKNEAPKAGKIMLLLLVVIYVTSLSLAVSLVPIEKFNTSESPFVTALNDYKLAFFPHVFNGAIIIAGFSTMTAALFGVTNLLVTISKNGNAPSFFSKKLKFKKLPLASMGLAAAGLLASVVTALLVPGKIYEYITTAAGILLLYNWSFIILSSLKILETKAKDKILAFLGIILILAAVSGTVAEKEIRFGFFVSLLFVGIIAIISFLLKKFVWDKRDNDKGSTDTLFEKN